MKKNKNTAFDYINYLILALFAIGTLYPFAYVLSVSLSDSASVVSGGITFYPKNINFDAYRTILVQEQFWVGYKNTIMQTFLGTALGLASTIMMAYPLSKKNLPGRKTFSKLVALSMFIPVGMIPSYLLVQSLGLINSIWAIVLPTSLVAYNVVITRNYFECIPDELDDAAAIDGLNDVGILIKIYLPLAKPIIATIALRLAIGKWNGWFTSMIYLTEQSKMPVMIFLRNIVNGAELAANNPNVTQGLEESIVSPVIRSATIVSVILPIICVYPFIQKYFVQGIMVGSVKG